MDPRKQRGLAIAERFRIQKRDGVWLVPSQSSNATYKVKLTNEEQTCNCPDFEHRGMKCKHVFAVEYVIEREDNGDGTVTMTERVQVTEEVKRTYRQSWPEYNAAQTNEKHHFQALLRDLCSTIEEPPSPKRGRPRIPLHDSVFSATFKVYSTVSGRRFMCDLRDAHDRGYISRLPCYNSIFNVLESKETTQLLTLLIAKSASPLRCADFVVCCKPHQPILQ